MVKIKTNNDDSSKNILALKSNFEELLKTLKQTNTLLSSQPTKTKTTSTTKSDDDDKKSLAKEIAKELGKNKSINEFRQIFLGGIMGISPAIIEKLSIDKVIHTAAKHSWNKITGLFKSDKDSKLGSAIEANKQTPVTQRLDAIYQELKSRRKDEQMGLSEQKKTTGLLGFIGKILNSGLVKALVALGSLVMISHAVFWLARHFGYSPNQPDALPQTVKGTTKTLDQVTKNATKAAELNKIKDNHFEKLLNTTETWNKTAKNLNISGADKAKLLSDEKEITAIKKAYGLSAEQADDLLNSRNAHKNALNSLFSDTNLKYADKVGITNKIERAAFLSKLAYGGRKLASPLLNVMRRVGRTIGYLGLPGVDAGVDWGIYYLLGVLETDPAMKKAYKRMGKSTALDTLKYGGIGAGIGTVLALAAAPFTGGTSLAAIPAMAGAGWAAGSIGNSLLVAPSKNARIQKEELDKVNKLFPKPEDTWINRNFPTFTGYNTRKDLWLQSQIEHNLLNKDRLNNFQLNDNTPAGFNLLNNATPVRKDEQIYEIDSTSGTIAASDQKNPAEDIRTEARTTNTTLDNIFELLQQYLDPNGYKSRFMTKIDPKTGEALPGQPIAGIDNMQIASINYIVNRGH